MKGKTILWLRALLLGSILRGEEIVHLRPYEVEAWHFDVQGLEVPADITRIEGSELEKSLGSSVPELLRQLAGVRFSGFTGNGAEGQFAMRGFGDNSGLRVLVLVDGLVYNPGDMSGINWMGLDVGELESIEVIQGGQSVLYGNHAVSGVIKLKTREPGREGESRFLLEAGSNASTRGSVGLGRTVDKVGVRAGVYYADTDGFRDNSASESRGGQIFWKSGGEEGTSWTGRVHIDRSEMQYPGPLTYQQALVNPRQSGYAEETGSVTESILATVGGKGSEAWGQWEAQAGFLTRDGIWSKGVDTGFTGTESENRQRRVTFTPRLMIPFGDSTVIMGTDLRYDGLEIVNYLNSSGQIKRAETDHQRAGYGGYIFGQSRLTDGWRLSGGIRMESADTDYRYTRYKEEQLRPELITNRGTVPNPHYKNPAEIDPDHSYDGPIRKSGWAAEISLVKSISKTLSIWGGWDRVYRYPSLDETASYQEYPLAIPFNAGLDPETGNNFELGIKRSGARWSGGATVYYLRMNGEIFFDETIPLNRNLGKTERTGVELDASWQSERYGLSTRIGWVDTGIRSEGGVSQAVERIPLVPELTAAGSAWILLGEDWRLAIDFQYQSDRIQGNDFMNMWRRIPAYSIGGVSLQWDFTQNFDMTLRINNVFDKHTIATAYSGGFYPGSGREIRVGLRGRF